MPRHVSSLVSHVSLRMTNRPSLSHEGPVPDSRVHHPRHTGLMARREADADGLKALDQRLFWA